MSVTDYLDPAYAVTVDDRVRRGANLRDALEATKDWAAQSDRGETVEVTIPAGGNTYKTAERVDPGGPGAPVSAQELQDAKATAAFMAQLGNVGGIK